MSESVAANGDALFAKNKVLVNVVLGKSHVLLNTVVERDCNIVTLLGPGVEVVGLVDR